LVLGFDELTELFGAFQFAISEPAFNEVETSRLDDGTDQFNGFKSVQLGLFKESREVLENGLRATRLSRSVLELFDSLGISDGSAWGVRSNSSSSNIISRGESLVELFKQDVFSTRKLIIQSKSSTDLSISLDVSTSSADELDEIVFIDVQSNKLSASVDDIDTVSLGVSGTDEDGVIRDLSLSNNGSRGDFDNKEVTELGHEVQKTVLGGNMHEDGEVIGELRRHSQFTSLLEFGLSFLGRADFVDVNSLSSFIGFSFEEGDNSGDVVFVMISDLTEGTAVTFQDLTLLSFNEAELHVTIDGLTTIRRADGREERPLFSRVQSQTNNLAWASKSARSNLK
jgi:hypothetical protein